MPIRRVFPDLLYNICPFETVSYNALTSDVTLTLENCDHQRITIQIDGLVGMRYLPTACYDIVDDFSIDGTYIRTILEAIDSQWIKDLKRQKPEEIVDDFRHFIFPSYDGVWEFLAYDCKQVSGAGG